MPYGNQMMSQGPPSDTMPIATPDESPKPEMENEGVTALVPKSILGGKEFAPGDEVILKVVKVYGDEVEVAYASGEEETETETGPSEVDQEIDNMAAMNE